MSNFNQGTPTVPSIVSASNIFLVGNTTSGTALSVQQLGAGGTVASFSNATGSVGLFVSSTSQVGIGTVAPGAQLQTTSNVFIGGFIQTSGAVGGINSQGAYIGWNLSTANGETDFINQKGLGSGGWKWLSYNSSNQLESNAAFLNFLGGLALGTYSNVGYSSVPTGGIICPGNVGIGTNSPSSYTLQVVGSIGATGDITAYYSDERLKTKTGALENALDKVCSLDTFTYVNNDLAKSFGFTDNKQKVGLSAQQVQKVLPEAVKIAPFDAEGKEGSKSGENYLTVQYEKLVPLLIAAIKEQAKQIEDLKKFVS